MADKKEEAKKEGTKNPAAEEEEEGDEGADVATMPPGDYSIHIFIERGKNFIGDTGKTSINALFQCNACGSEAFSSVEKNVALRNEKGCFFGHHVYLEPRGLSVDDVAGGNLEIKLLNQESILRDDLIGTFEIDLPKIYGMSENHSL